MSSSITPASVHMNAETIAKLMANRPSVNLDWLQKGKPSKRRQVEASASVAKRSKGGAVPLHEKFPSLLPTVTEHLESNGFRAHRRRQEEIGTCGTTLPELRQHLFREVPGLQEEHPSLRKHAFF